MSDFFFDALLLEVERLQAEVNQMMQQKSDVPEEEAPRTEEPIFGNRSEQQKEYEPPPSERTAILPYHEVVRMQAALAQVAPHSKLAKVKISERFYEERIQGRYDHEALLETLEVALDVDRSAQAIVKHQQEGNVTLEVIQAIYAVMACYGRLGFEQLLRFLHDLAADDLEEFMQFFESDWFERKYRRTHPNRRQRLLEALRHAMLLAYGGNLFRINYELTEDLEGFEQRIALVPISQASRLMFEETRRKYHSERR